MPSPPEPNPGPPGAARTAQLTLLALIAFAGNSLLCRAALVEGPEGASIGPTAFTSIRLLSGALTLAPLLGRSRRAEGDGLLRRGGALALVVYATGFSLSYVSIPAGVGALLLFGTVQVTMLTAARINGEPRSARQTLGLVAASAGLIVLVGIPSGQDPVDPLGAALMVGAGVGWGVYTLLGRGRKDATRETALNFLNAAPAALLLLVVALWRMEPWDARGTALAVCSGAITSGLGYAIWYAALRGHSRTSAAAVQLSVPLIAAAGGVVLLEESATATLLASSVLILGGVGLTITRPREREADEQAAQRTQALRVQPLERLAALRRRSK